MNNVSIASNIISKAYKSNPSLFQKILEDSSNSTSQMYQRAINLVASDSMPIVYPPSIATMVEMDMDGDVLFLSKDAEFASTKQEIKEIMSSVNKINDDISMADAKNGKALIASPSKIPINTMIAKASNGIDDTLKSIFSLYYANTKFDISNITWEYFSNKKVNSFYKIYQINEISVNEDNVYGADVTTNKNSVIRWTNNSSIPIYIYSGYTNYDLFYANPDLSMYGKQFKSGVINPGEYWETMAYELGETYWFSYPSIFVGKIVVEDERIRSNDTFLICENDGLNVPFASRVIKVDYDGNVLWSFGEQYLINPKRAVPLKNGNIVINT